MKNSMQNDEEEGRRMDEELTRRIDEIEETIANVKPMTKKDYIVASVITVVCLIIVVAGAFWG